MIDIALGHFGCLSTFIYFSGSLVNSELFWNFSLNVKIGRTRQRQEYTIAFYSNLRNFNKVINSTLKKMKGGLNSISLCFGVTKLHHWLPTPCQRKLSNGVKSNEIGGQLTSLFLVTIRPANFCLIKSIMLKPSVFQMNTD